MGRLVSILLLAAVGCFGQVSQNTVYQTVSNIVAAGQVFPLSVSNNIGQSSHILQAILTNAAGHSCVPTQIPYVKLEGSYDNSTWVPIGTPINETALDSNGVLSGSVIVYGSYPRIRMNVVAFDATNCVMQLNYTGALYPVSLSSTVNGVNSNFRQVSAEPHASGTNTLLGVLSTGTRTVIYGLHVLNEAVSATPFTLQEFSGTCAGGSAVGTVLSIAQVGIPAGGQITIPASNVPFYVSLNVNPTFCIVTTNTNALEIELVYRYE